MLKCLYCDYATNRKFNLKMHYERKISCKIKNNDDLQKILLDEPKVVIDKRKVSETNETHSCNKCNKSLHNASSLKRHIKICKGVDSLTCPNCKMCFKTKSTKWYHKNNVNCVPIVDNPIPTSLIADHGININGNNNTASVNVIYNNFGYESISHITKQNDICYVMKKYAKRKIFGFVQMLTDILLDKEHPQNRTIMKLTERGNMMHVRDNEENISDMRLREFEDTRCSLLNLIRKCFEMYYGYIFSNDITIIKDSDEEIDIKHFIRLYFSLGGEHLTFLSYFDIEDEDYINIMNPEDVIRYNKTFDTATKDVIHLRTSVLLKNILKKQKHDTELCS